MNFEWNEDKRQRNLEKHGIDFLRACQVFDGRPRLDIASPRKGEQRFQTTAQFGSRFVTVVWTERAGVVRIISARRARDGEERAHRQVFR
jgi:uncharacterized DUF497 family protein